MSNIPYACLYTSYGEELSLFSDEQVGRLMRALMRYQSTGRETELPMPERLFWPRLRTQHDRDADHYDEVCLVRSANGRKGGRPKANGFDIAQFDSQKANGFECAQFDYPKANGFQSEKNCDPKAKKAKEAKEKEKEKENEKEIEKEKEIKKENHKDSLSLLGGERERIGGIPDLNDVQGYCREAGLEHLDARHFVDYYSATGWMCGDKPMKDWRAMARLWEQRAAREQTQNDIEPEGTYGTTI